MAKLVFFLATGASDLFTTEVASCSDDGVVEDKALNEEVGKRMFGSSLVLRSLQEAGIDEVNAMITSTRNSWK